MKFLKLLFTRDQNAPDIKFLGKLGYREMRIIGWFFLGISQLALIFNVASVLYADSFPIYSKLAFIADFFSSIPFALFLLADFGTIFKHKDNYKSLLLKYVSIAVGFAILIIFVVLHIYIQASMAISGISFVEAYEKINASLNASYAKSMSLNMFIDILMCSLIYFFLTYEPKSKYFEGKKKIRFRLMVALPILYELICVLIKTLILLEHIQVPFFIIPFLTSKPILTFFSFLLIIIALKVREKLFLKRGNDKESYSKYVLTNRNRVQFSIVIAVIFLVIGLIDLIISFAVATSLYYYGPIEYQISYEWTLMYLRTYGVGKTAPLMLAVPFVIFFDYSKQYKKQIFEPLIPVGGVIFTAIVLFEGLFQVIINAPMWHQ